MAQKTLSEWQEEVAAFVGDVLRYPRLGNALALVEEVGELVKEIMEREIHGQPGSQESFEDELGDVMFALLDLASSYQLNVETALQRKFDKILGKKEKWVEKYAPSLAEKRKKLD